jgi:hypothetical protein
VVVPTWNVEPGAKLEVSVTPLQLSNALGLVQLTTALHIPGSALVTIFEGVPKIEGAWLSITVTVNEVVPVFPEASVAV